jgi:hypothetical protein
MLDVNRKRAEAASLDWLMALCASTSTAVGDAILVTTSMENVTLSCSDREMREGELKQLWEEIIGEPGRELAMCRFEGTYHSAWTAIDLLVGSRPQ